LFLTGFIFIMRNWST